MIVDALRAGKPLPKSGFISSGAEVITKSGRDRGPRAAADLDGEDQGVPDERGRAEVLLPPALLREGQVRELARARRADRECQPLTTSSAAKGVGASAPAPGSPKISFAGLSKHYGGVHALDDVGFDVEAGHDPRGRRRERRRQVHADEDPRRSGEARRRHDHARRRALDALSPRQAHQRGIGIVYQELSLFPERSVLANLFPNNEPTRFGLISRAAMARRAEPVLREIGLDVDLDGRSGTSRSASASSSSSAACSSRAAVLILDEPNSASQRGRDARLFAVLRRLRDSGITMLYVSHRLEEVFAIADSITVMRNGRHVLTAPRSELTIAEVVAAMLGRDERALYPERTGEQRAPGTLDAPAGRDGACGAAAVEGRQLRGARRRDRRARRDSGLGRRRPARRALRHPQGPGRRRCSFPTGPACRAPRPPPPAGGSASSRPTGAGRA